MLQEVFNQTQ